MEIKILGGGCAKCQKLYDNTLEALELVGKTANVQKVTDMSIIMKYHVLSTPALVIDEKVVSSGQVLKSDTISTLL